MDIEDSWRSIAALRLAVADLLDGLDEPSVKRIMRSNTAELLGLPA